MGQDPIVVNTVQIQKEFQNYKKLWAKCETVNNDRHRKMKRQWDILFRLTYNDGNTLRS